MLYTRNYDFCIDRYYIELHHLLRFYHYFLIYGLLDRIYGFLDRNIKAAAEFKNEVSKVDKEISKNASETALLGKVKLQLKYITAQSY